MPNIFTIKHAASSLPPKLEKDRLNSLESRLAQNNRAGHRRYAFQIQYT